ncbi:MAG: tetratricopeptide repeat protein [candidate division KSB1 bacterium]|nr:tetratricopeptide repeat protein [candidate division KSB1 bacterium]MDZ7367545.1 tetratricopeptide repeat protein [candidate division KSB1 bacterium]MDZ7404897.1 tetratricopeptide repeat protein [candidate division KSB1 bacterium]
MSCAYHNRLDYIADYVRDELPDDEQEKFETHYLACDKCLEAVRFMEKTSLAMRHYGSRIFAPIPQTSWLDRLKIWWGELPLSQQWKDAIPAFATYLLFVGIMSVGYYLFNYGIMSDSSSHQDRSGGMMQDASNVALYEVQHFNWDQPPANTTEPALLNSLAEIQPIYQAHDYKLAAARLTQVVQDFPHSLEAHLFLGISQLRLKQASDAIQNLEKALQIRPDYAPAQWYLSQGYLMQDRFVEARQQLAALMKQQDPHFKKLAERSLQKLNKQNK